MGLVGRSMLSTGRSIITALLTLGVLVGSLMLLEIFFSYSFAMGGWHGLPAYNELYREAQTHQIFSFAAFFASQALGGTLLRRLIRAIRPRGERRVSLVHWLGELVAYTTGFGFVTAICAGIVLVARH
jgi:hypothetical protein